MEHVFHFADDYDGPVVSTLVYHSIESDRAVLYIHGYTDYFFQDHVAQWFVSHGYSFYAIDLRKYGRSLLPSQHPNFCMSLTEYYDDITASLEYIKGAGATQIVLIGHSTGGLLASLYMADGPARGLVSKLILNSPFFEFNTTPLKRNIIIPLASLISRLFPFIYGKPELSPYYAQSVHREHYGEWDFNTEWKPLNGFPLYFSWLSAVRSGQRKLHKGLHIQIPVLVICSQTSYCSSAWDPQYLTSDSVLNVEHIIKYAPRVGSNVEIMKFEGGLHDLFLSSGEVRKKLFHKINSFIEST